MQKKETKKQKNRTDDHWYDDLFDDEDIWLDRLGAKHLVQVEQVHLLSATVS